MQQNRDLIQSLYDAFARGDGATVLGSLTADAEWNEAEGSPYADRNPYIGAQQVGEGVFGRLLADYQDFAVKPELLVAEGEHVVAFGRYSGRRASSGEALDAQFVHHWRIRDGKVISFQQYTDTAQYSRLAMLSA
jgi:uncharacterized protein